MPSAPSKGHSISKDMLHDIISQVNEQNIVFAFVTGSIKLVCLSILLCHLLKSTDLYNGKRIVLFSGSFQPQFQM